jgi:multiple sugar transport system substrate-binding protein
LDRRQLIRGAAGTAAGLFAAPLIEGCGGGASLRAPRPGELVFRGWAYEPNEVRDNLDVFEHRHADIPVDYAAVSGNYHDKMVAIFVARTTLDCCYVRDDHFAEWADARWIQPLPFAEAAAYQSDIFPFNWEAITYQGKLYGLPYYSDFTIWVYNQRMLEEGGIERCGRTLDEIAEQCIRLKEKGVIQTPLALGLIQAPLGFNDWWALNYASEVDLFDDDWNPVFPDDPGRRAERVLQWMVDGIHRHGIIDREVSFNMPVIRDNFAAGRQAFISLSKYDLQRLNNPLRSSVAGQAKMALYPSLEPGQRGTLGWTRMYCLTSTCRDPVKAWELIRFLGGRDETGQYYTARRWYLKFGLGFAYRSLLNDPEIIASTARWGDIELIREQWRWAKAREVIKAPWFPEFDTYYQAELQRVLNREISPRDGLGRMAAEVRRLKRDWAV